MNNKNIIEEKIILKRESYDFLNETIRDQEEEIDELKGKLRTREKNLSEVNIAFHRLENYILSELAMSIYSFKDVCPAETLLDESNYSVKDYFDICKELGLDTDRLKECVSNVLKQDEESRGYGKNA